MVSAKERPGLKLVDGVMGDGVSIDPLSFKLTVELISYVVS